MALLAELLSEAIQTPTVRSVYPQIPDIELPQKWLEFEETLGEFKREYKQTLVQLRNCEKEFANIMNDLSIIQNSVTAVQDPLMQSELSTLAEKYKHEHKYQEKQDETAHLAGTIRAMENVLVHTNAKKYNQFTCSVCMDHPVDIFLDPCGHVFCETCVLQFRNIQCPTCRARFIPKKIYT